VKMQAGSLHHKVKMQAGSLHHKARMQAGSLHHKAKMQAGSLHHKAHGFTPYSSPRITSCGPGRSRNAPSLRVVVFMDRMDVMDFMDAGWGP